ncbi:MAG TPA: glycosyltransferase [Roseiflexaceae bacterium]|nr:glycosyltransferase [Roseiflexaceae bacterium]HMP43293.1 glycosyltransferase [Roseiflexaceae bacterium]
MRRLAYLSPVNPAASGISDYSEELLPYLGQYAEITLYVEDGLRPANQLLAQGLEIRPISRLERDQRRRRYDAILYQIGNSMAHAAIWDAAQRLPGVIVLHDFVLHHFMLQYLVTRQRNIGRYRAEAVRRYGDMGARVGELMLRGRFSEAAFDMPFCEEVVAAADGLICHSRYIAERVVPMRPDLPFAVVPMGVPLPQPIERATVRRLYGLPEDALILASFGHINPYKRVGTMLRVVADLRAEGRNVHYLLVGSVSPQYDLHSAIERAGLHDCVRATGYVDRAAFEAYLAAADICINLRHPTAGETSASLLRLLGAGRPTLVTSTGSFVELPPAVAAQVDLGSGEVELLCAYCRYLADHPAFAAAMGAAARRYVAHEHTLPAAAAGYMHFLAQRYGWDAPQIQREPLWQIDPPLLSLVAADALPAPVQPAVRAVPSGTEALIATVAGAAAGLAAGESDTSLLAAAARAIGELTGE